MVFDTKIYGNDSAKPQPMNVETAKSLVAKGWVRMTKKKFASIVDAIFPNYLVRLSTEHHTGRMYGRLRAGDGWSSYELNVYRTIEDSKKYTGEAFRWYFFSYEGAKSALNWIREEMKEESK